MEDWKETVLAFKECTHFSVSASVHFLGKTYLNHSRGFNINEHPWRAVGASAGTQNLMFWNGRLTLNLYFKYNSNVFTLHSMGFNSITFGLRIQRGSALNLKWVLLMWWNVLFCTICPSCRASSRRKEVKLDIFKSKVTNLVENISIWLMSSVNWWMFHKTGFPFAEKSNPVTFQQTFKWWLLLLSKHLSLRSTRTK